MILALSGLLIFALVGLFARGTPQRAAGTGSLAPPANDLHVAFAALLTAGSFWFWCSVVASAAQAQRPFPAWFATLPLLVIDDRAPRYGNAPFGALAGLAAALATLGLCGTFFALRNRRLVPRTWAILGAACAVMATIALRAPALTSFDLYAYAGAARAGLPGGYAPSDVRFGGTWAALNAIYGNPIVPSPYGPLWLGLSHALTDRAPSLGFALETLRVLELGALACSLVALRALRLPPQALALFALDPALFANFVVDGHNDILAIAFVLAAAALRERAWPLAVLLAACAAGVKLPFVVIAPLAFAGEPSAKKRLAFASATVVAGCGLSLAGGPQYLAALRATFALYGATLADPATVVLKSALLACAVAAVVAAMVRRRFVPTLSWTFVAFGASLFGWYLAWGIPYAVAERRWLPGFLIALPSLGYLLSTSFAATAVSTIALPLALVVAPAFAYAAILRERRGERRSVMTSS
ncbi:MAG: hypothetical protein IAI49_11075 [Candidatus Eremiobacteraeota bacterium]|nr:hypothetical protein [Candidatus Eremiobacteraeota bacterium]